MRGAPIICSGTRSRSRTAGRWRASNPHKSMLARRPSPPWKMPRRLPCAAFHLLIQSAVSALRRTTCFLYAVCIARVARAQRVVDNALLRRGDAVSTFWQQDKKGWAYNLSVIVSLLLCPTTRHPVGIERRVVRKTGLSMLGYAPAIVNDQEVSTWKASCEVPIAHSLTQRHVVICWITVIWTMPCDTALPKVSSRLFRCVPSPIRSMHVAWKSRKQPCPTTAGGKSG